MNYFYPCKRCEQASNADSNKLCRKCKWFNVGAIGGLITLYIYGMVFTASWVGPDMVDNVFQWFPMGVFWPVAVPIMLAIQNPLLATFLLSPTFGGLMWFNRVKRIKPVVAKKLTDVEKEAESEVEQICQ